MRLMLFAQGLRPFFLLAGLDAIFNVAVWLLAYFHPEIWPAAALPAMYWHAHELLFGFIAAAIAGFLLTAVPGWTGRSSYAGPPLMVLTGIWLAGREVGIQKALRDETSDRVWTISRAGENNGFGGEGCLEVSDRHPSPQLSHSMCH